MPSTFWSKAMYNLDSSFSVSLFTRLIYANMVYEAPDKLLGTSGCFDAALVGGRFSTSSSKFVHRPFLPRLSRAYMRSIYSGICRGSLLDKDRISWLYALGLGLPKSDILSQMWLEVPYKGAIELPDGSQFSFSELKSILKAHMKSAFADSMLYVYPSATVKYYKQIMQAVQPVKTKRKLTDVVLVSGSTADVILTYKCHRGQFVLSHAITLLDGKYADVTYQVMDNINITQSFENTISDKLEGRCLSIIGKFVFSDAASGSVGQEDLDAKVNEIIDLDLDTFETTHLEKLKTNSASKRFVDKYRDKYYKATNFIRFNGDKKRPSAKLLRTLQQAQALIDEVDKHRVLFRAERRDVRSKRSDSPSNVLTFKAYDMVMVSGDASKPINREGGFYRTVNADYQKLAEKLKSLGFKTMGKKRSSPNCKKLFRYVDKGKAYWAEA